MIRCWRMILMCHLNGTLSYFKLKKKCVWVFFLKKLTLHKNVNERIFILRLSDKLVAYSAWSESHPMDCTMFTSYDQPSNVLLLIITIIILCYCMYVIHQAFETEWITHEIVLKDDQWGSCSQTNCIIQETVCHYITPKLLTVWQVCKYIRNNNGVSLKKTHFFQIAIWQFNSWAQVPVTHSNMSL